MSEPLLIVDSLRVAYGRVEVVHGVSLTVGPSEVVTVIGANGAGKTTFLNAVMGILPARGAIAFDGKPVGDASLEERVASGLCLVPERRELFSDMSVRDNLRLGGIRQSADARAEALEAIYQRFPRLKERRHQLAGTLSGGERQMLAMGRALMGRPKLLMLDERSLGLAPRIIDEVFEIIADLKRAGVAILLVEQNAHAALAAASRAYVMELGEVRREGSAAAIREDSSLVESYLGMGGTTY